MWKLAPTEKLALLLITAGMVAVTSIFVACWVVSTCHDRKGKGSRKKIEWPGQSNDFNTLVYYDLIRSSQIEMHAAGA